MNGKRELSMTRATQREVDIPKRFYRVRRENVHEPEEKPHPTDTGTRLFSQFLFIPFLRVSGGMD